MASLTRNKIYVLLIGILLLSNLALVAFFVLNKPAKKEVRTHTRPGSYMKEALKNDVGFTDEQLKQFEQMAEQHKKNMRPMFEDIARTKENFYRLITQPGTPDSVLNKSAREIGDKQELIDLKIFMHFQSIREMTTPEQQPKFDSLVQRVVHKMVFPMRKGEGKKDSGSLKK